MNQEPLSPVRPGGTTRPAAIALLLSVLAVAWLLWSGLYKPLLLGLGAFSCLLSAYLAARMGFFRHEALFRVVPKMPGYWWWLLQEIVSSSIEVARLVLHPAMPISPTLVEIDAETGSEVGQVILGNSITLSPGTVTLDVHKGRLLVHCLTREGARALRAGEANRRVARLGLD
jgi:multicomponent Na+:H+ antiporter subunit E